MAKTETKTPAKNPDYCCKVKRSDFNELKARMEASRRNFGPCDFKAAEKALFNIYDKMGFNRPKIIKVAGFHELYTKFNDGTIKASTLASPLMRDFACHAAFDNKQDLSKFPGYVNILSEFVVNPNELRVMQEEQRRQGRAVTEKLNLEEPSSRMAFDSFYQGFTALDAEASPLHTFMDILTTEKKVPLERALQFVVQHISTMKLVYFASLMARSEFGIFPFNTWEHDWVDLADNCGFFVPYGDTVVLGERPVRVSQDDRLRLDNEKEAAFEGRDGLKIYYVDGVRLSDSKIVTNPKSQTIDEIVKEPNAEIRAIRMRLFGMLEFVQKTNPRVIDKRDPAQSSRKIIEMLCESDAIQGRRIFVCQCISTGRVFNLYVPQNINTCGQAQEWLMGQPGITEKDCLLTT